MPPERKAHWWVSDRLQVTMGKGQDLFPKHFSLRVLKTMVSASARQQRAALKCLVLSPSFLQPTPKADSKLAPRVLEWWRTRKLQGFGFLFSSESWFNFPLSLKACSIPEGLLPARRPWSIRVGTTHLKRCSCAHPFIHVTNANTVLCARQWDRSHERDTLKLSTSFRESPAQWARWMGRKTSSIEGDGSCNKERRRGWKRAELMCLPRLRQGCRTAAQRKVREACRNRGGHQGVSGGSALNHEVWLWKKYSGYFFKDLQECPMCSKVWEAVLWRPTLNHADRLHLGGYAHSPSTHVLPRAAGSQWMND